MFIKEQKKEVIIIFISVIILSLIINLLSSLIFDNIPDSLKPKVIWILAFIAFIVLSILYLIITSRLGKKRLNVMAPLCLNYSTFQFEALPYNKFSVRARNSFEKFNIDEILKCQEGYDFEEFFGGRLEKKLDMIIQESVLSVIIRQLGIQQPFKTLDFNSLPTSIKSNYILKYAIENKIYKDYKIDIPYLQKLSTYGRNDSFISLSTKFGRLKYSWRYSILRDTFYVKPFICNDYGHEYHEICIHLSTDISIKHWFIFARGMEKFNEWLDIVNERFLSFDWNSNEMDRTFSLISKIEKSIIKHLK